MAFKHVGIDLMEPCSAQAAHYLEAVLIWKDSSKRIAQELVKNCSAEVALDACEWDLFLQYSAHEGISMKYLKGSL